MIVASVTILNMVKINSMSEKINSVNARIAESLKTENWQDIKTSVKEISDIWKENRTWVGITLSAKQIDEIEISLEQSLVYSEIESKDSFMGEYRMFCMLIEHLPKQEGVSLSELV